MLPLQISINLVLPNCINHPSTFPYYVVPSQRKISEVQSHKIFIKSISYTLAVD